MARPFFRHRFPRRYWALALWLPLLTGCVSPGFIVSRWDSGHDGPLQTRCERLDFNQRGALQDVFARYDGWKMVYLAQPDINALHFDGLACFERHGVPSIKPATAPRVDQESADVQPSPAPDVPNAPPRKSMSATPTF